MHLDKFKNNVSNDYVENFKFTDSFNLWSTGYFSSELIVDYNYGRIVGVSCLAAYSDNFLVLKEHGCIQVWNNKEKRIINRFTDFSLDNVTFSDYCILFVKVLKTLCLFKVYIFSNSSWNAISCRRNSKRKFNIH